MTNRKMPSPGAPHASILYFCPPVKDITRSADSPSNRFVLLSWPVYMNGARSGIHFFAILLHCEKEILFPDNNKISVMKKVLFKSR